MVLGLLGAAAKLSGQRALVALATVYTTLIRGIPELVLMLLVFYGGSIGMNHLLELSGTGTTLDVNPFTAGVLTLGFIYGAYMTETFRGAILSIPRGQFDAAAAFGMRPVLVVGGILALAFALALTGPSKVLQRIVGAYTFVIRGTPLLIQVYMIYYGLLQLGWIQARWGTVWPWTQFKDPFFRALLALCLNTAGYTAEMLAGAIRETNAGEIESAQAFGMSRFQLVLRIVLPSAMRRTLPAYSNEVVMVLHATSLASAVPAMLDVTAAASRIYSDFYLPFEAYLAAAAIYLSCTFCLIGIFKLAERHFLAHLAPRKH